MTTRIAGALAGVAGRYRILLRVFVSLLVIAYFLFAGLLLGIRYVVLPNIGTYKPQIERAASESLGSLVTFSGIRASWYGFQPKIDLTDVRIADTQGREVVRLENVSAVVSLLSIPLMDVRLDRLQIDRPDVSVMRDAQGKFYVAGMLVDPDRKENGGFSEWLLKQHEIIVTDGTLRWKDDLRGGAALTLSNMNFALKNQGRRHRFRLVGTPDAAVAGVLDMRGDLWHPRFADRVSDVSTWEGDLYAYAQRFDVGAIRRFVDFPVELDSGAGSAQVWATLEEARLKGLVADLDGRNIRLRLDGRCPVLDLRQASGRFLMDAYEGDGVPSDRPVYNYSVKGLSLLTAEDKRLTNASFSVLYVPGANEGPGEVRLNIAKLNVGEVKAFSPYIPLDGKVRQAMERFDASGRLSDFSLAWKSGETPSYAIRGGFENLSFKESSGARLVALPGSSGKTVPIPNYPGVVNLTGSIDANENEGSLNLQSKNTALILPLYSLDDPLTFEEISASLKWERSGDNVLSMDIADLSFLQYGMRAQVSGTYTNDLSSRTNRAGYLDATAKIENLDIANVRKYVPPVAPKDLYEWLYNALRGGRASTGTIQVKGNLADFPFVGGKNGRFTVKAKIVDGLMNYAPNLFAAGGRRQLWPDLEKIQGEFMMDGSYLAVHADRAITSTADLRNVDVVIADVMADAPVLDIKGSAEGSIQNMVSFVNASPVAEWIGGLTEKTTASGTANLALTLKLPLARLETSRVNGTLKFNGNDIVLLEDLPVVSGTQGQLTFTEKGFLLDRLRGTFMHEPVTIVGGTRADGSFLVRADGVLSAKGLQKTYPTGFLGRLMTNVSGSSPYVVNVSDREVRINSNLKGLQIDLPSPLGKTAAAAAPLEVVLFDRPRSAGMAQDELDIVYGSHMSARYLRQKDRSGYWRVAQGGIGINRGPAPKAGLALDMSLHNLDINEWHKILNKLFAGAATQSSSSSNGAGLAQYMYPHSFSISADELSAMDLWLTDARLKGTHQGRTWDIDVASEQLAGNIKWIEDSDNMADGKLVARLKSMNVQQSSMKRVSDMTERTDIYRIPSLDIVTDDLTIFGRHLGHTEIVADNVAHGNGWAWQINRLRISNPDAVLDATGSWANHNGNEKQTRLNYTLDIKNAGKLLSRLGYSDLIKKGHGEMKGELSWDGLPFALDIPSLSGKLSLKVEGGQFLKADAGAAKLLGVISLQSLPRRLTLDFRDIFAQGFAFDEITSNATISSGVMQTDNFKMNGANATVMIDGKVDIRRESQDLHLVIIPEFDAGAASIAYGFINPAVGVGTFLAQMFLKEPLMKQFTHTYHVTGSWKDPVMVDAKNGFSDRK